ncbi:EAL domain-containing protein [Desulfospira joergensenii]|uniref:EAL domain-containing protein n=1 Tax=Desulfospira joergensenii TaxID=53329 RepID=UPI0003B66C85|nr:EAL domain-containing protein [Desulfospira joergensenii]
MKSDIRLDLPFIREWAVKKRPYLTGQMNGLDLYTALQPIFSLAHKRVVGHEALVRVKDTVKDRWVSPVSLFDTNKGSAELIHLDRLCRYIHINNFKSLDNPVNWLFLNVSPTTIINGMEYGSYFRELLELFDFPPHRIVIEVVEHPISDNYLLMENIEFYKSLGCLVAIDDFGAGHSNFNRIWNLKPDIVKLDRSFLVKASQQKNIRALLPGIIALLHQAGSLVLVEGIETRDQAIIAIESDADFVQGFYFGRPFTNLSDPPRGFDQFGDLFKQYKDFSNRDDLRFQKRIDKYSCLFTRSVEGLKSGLTTEEAVTGLMSDPSVARCYLIGTDGIQIGRTLFSKSCALDKDQRFKPIEDARNADWFRRHYLKRAILHPDQLQITRPYLSITGAHMCITLSMKFKGPEKDSVLCCDLVL